MYKIEPIDITKIDENQFIEYYMMNLKKIYYSYSKKNLVKALNNINRNTLSLLRQKLSDFYLKINNIPDIFSLKKRRDKCAITYITTDIYLLTFSSLEKKFFAKLNDIFTIKLKPHEILSSFNIKVKIDNMNAASSNTNQSIDMSQLNESIINYRNSSRNRTIDNEPNEQSLNKSPKIDPLCDFLVKLNKNVEALAININMLNCDNKLLHNKIDNAVSAVSQIQQEVFNRSTNKSSLNSSNGKSSTNNSNKKHTDNTVQRKKTIVLGESYDSTIKTAPPKPQPETFTICISNVDISENDLNIKELVNKLGFNLLEFTRKQLNHKFFKAYLVTIPYEQTKKVYDAQIWPKGLKIFKHVDYNNTKTNNLNQKTKKRKADDDSPPLEVTNPPSQSTHINGDLNNASRAAIDSSVNDIIKDTLAESNGIDNIAH